MGNSKNSYICGENFGNRYSVLNSVGVNCCKCIEYSNFDKNFLCQNCNSEFCFKCGKGNYPKKYYNCYICGENFGNRYSVLNSVSVNCCKCMKYSNFDKKFSCQNCNSEFCFKCGQN